ncbi:UNVERIFIED_CONTAM: acetyltransferase (GNAT) family protein [Acetivibrio alkalicellulosi]
MSTTALYHLTKEDIPRAVDCLKDAFKNDPLWNEVFKEDPNKEKVLSFFFRCPLLYGMKYGEIYATSSALEAIAVCVPGKYSNMTIWRMLRCGALLSGTRMGKETLRNLSILQKQLAPDRKRLMKDKPYTYLMIIGVTSSCQGKGFGSRIMNVIKEDCDKKGLHLYLETETEENLRFYNKHDCNLLQKVVLKKLNLPMWQMAREPQSPI